LFIKLLRFRIRNLSKTPRFPLHSLVLGVKCYIGEDFLQLCDRSIVLPHQVFPTAQLFHVRWHGNRRGRIPLYDGIGKNRIDRQLKGPETIHRQIDRCINRSIAFQEPAGARFGHQVSLSARWTALVSNDRAIKEEPKSDGLGVVFAEQSDVIDAFQVQEHTPSIRAPGNH